MLLIVVVVVSFKPTNEENGFDSLLFGDDLGNGSCSDLGLSLFSKAFWLTANPS